MNKLIDLCESVVAWLIAGALIFGLPLFLLIHNITTVWG